MSVKYERHEGSQSTKPAVIDIESSKVFVYLRKNIERITKEDGTQLWQYDEAKISHEEYNEIKSSAALELSNTVNESNLAIMEALISNYETFTENQLAIMTAISDLYEIVAEKTEE